jgi:mRNA-degrading endonuclease RelE of RelBE toxin-antitoxin system|tara:strand:+ start:83 stop:334 length:252 start_codon:yes stop_codon:yes gene_type:complete
MYKVEFSRKADFQFSKLDNSLQERILNIFNRIKIRPHHFVKKKGGTNYYILRIGKYRAILDIKKNKLIVLVIEIGLRKNIYKN